MVKPEKGMLKGKVTSVLFKGVHYEIEVNENGRLWILHNTQNAQVGSELGLDIYPEDIHIMRKVSE
jgi:spermidine/putrescine transport system ATP-binding protein